MAPPLRTHTPLGRLMVDEGWTAAELSRVSGIYSRTLSNYLRGDNILDTHLIVLADALDVPIEALVDDNED